MPWLAIAAFADLRSSEIGRLKGNESDRTGRRLYVPASKALKVRRCWRVPIKANLFAWLLPWHHATGRLYNLADPQKCLGQVHQRLGEHSGWVAAWMGNSEAKVKTPYVLLRTVIFHVLAWN